MIKLQSLYIHNFKGCRERKIDFSDSVTSISGANGTGKTTIYDAFLWLLFGTNSVGMSDKINCMPHELSGGEQQRVAIARALLNEPKIIIADEPTGNLDPETATNIVQLLKDITQTGTSVVMSTHNIPMLDKFPGKVYRCKNGCITDITKERNKIEVE